MGSEIGGAVICWSANRGVLGVTASPCNTDHICVQREASNRSLGSLNA